jgi:hypothetical protein
VKFSAGYREIASRLDDVFAAVGSDPPKSVADARDGRAMESDTQEAQANDQSVDLGL